MSQPESDEAIAVNRPTYSAEEVKALQRLPLSKLRRILPEQPYSWYVRIIEEQVQASDNQKYVFSHRDHIGLHFVGRGSECDVCDGNGHFDKGSHRYDCAECDGDGYSELNDDCQVVISAAGEIQWSECIGITKRTA